MQSQSEQSKTFFYNSINSFLRCSCTSLISTNRQLKCRIGRKETLIAIFSENETPQSKIKRLIFGNFMPTCVCSCKQISKSPIEYIMLVNAFLSKSVFSHVIDLRDHLVFLLIADF